MIWTPAPMGWEEVESRSDLQRCYRRPGLIVLVSERVEADGKRWRHVSVSRKERLPSWDELRAVKDAFMGREAHAVQVLPPQSEWVNLCPTALHLFECLEGRPLPDFRVREEGMVSL